MAQPDDIQRYPSGLLELLGMRGSGQTPGKLTSEVRPTIDTAFLYGSDNEVLLVSSNAAVASGGQLTINITQHHMLTSLSAIIIQNAAPATTLMAAQLAIRVRTVTNAVADRYWVAQAGGTLGAAGDAVVISFVPPQQPFIVSPGGLFNFQLNTLVGSANVTASLIAAACPL